MDAGNDEASASVIASSGASPGLYRTRDLKHDLDDRVSTPC
jgi:hypothetical protein